MSYIPTFPNPIAPPRNLQDWRDWQEWIARYSSDEGIHRKLVQALANDYVTRIAAAEATLAGLGTLATKNAPLDEAYGGTGAATFPIPFHLEFYSTNATAAGSSYYGYLDGTDTTSALEVPTGTTMKVLMTTMYAKTGGSAGTYSVAPVLFNVTDSGVALLAPYKNGAAATDLYTNNKGTLAAPITILAAGKRFLVGWQNRGTSPGALDAAAKHHVIVTGYFV